MKIGATKWPKSSGIFSKIIRSANLQAISWHQFSSTKLLFETLRKRDRPLAMGMFSPIIQSLRSTRAKVGLRPFKKSGAPMSIVVVGSIAFDTIKTPSGMREKSLGGAANYFAVAAQFFGPVQMVGIVGEDFPHTHLEYLQARGVDISGIERVVGKSFHWEGEYDIDLNEAKTITTELNVFEHFLPNLPADFGNADTVFLANIDPELQIHVLKQMKAPKIKALDSMNFWIDRKNAALKQAISMIDILFLNDTECRALTGEHNILKAARAACRLGARIVVIKRGEFGALLCCDNDVAFVPAFLLEEVCDPTGAGDTFAGGFLGYLNQKKTLDLPSLKHAMVMGTVMSSFVIEQFSFDRMLELDHYAIMERKKQLLAISQLS